ncbi:TPA: hypothetical protein MC704_000974 [Escherichia coli]|uniref:hypothetical protein n=1 Tax=Escherichia coli TaxID=562 RepID=UPI001F1FDF6A|nr:hypothetical protein [Escherichia coli]EHX1168945.1 hypothetical protein [Escherichia coli]EJB7488689.1 hypothetical protein [Escherichia coli]MCF7401209.1 hypothetical protein [Escherichia coli]HAW5880995.1 hypothetical protein [Escherichia coli]HBU7189868.1 hypothetical protein [Escherichia coli]
MNEEIEALTRQYQILEDEAQRYTGEKRAELFKAAAKVKQQIVTRLNEKTAPNKPENKVPGSEYWENGNSFIDEYFNNLTPDMERYFTTREDMFDGAPSMPAPTATNQLGDDEEERRKLRQRILRAVGC